MAASLKGSNPYLLVAAIDFGTTFSSWAYQFRQDYERNPTKVYSKTWPSSSNVSSKAPTTLLIHPDGTTFHSFGYAAEEKFEDLVFEGKHESWYYFRQFKMKLFQSKKIDIAMPIKAQNGKTLPALLAFSLVIEQLKEDLMGAVNNHHDSVDISEHDVLWVLTVPAIWNDGAKHFMRQAAIKAGIEDDNLLIALEPEAASVYCRQMALDSQRRLEARSSQTFSPGQKYLLLDAGGGTIDIDGHEVLDNDELRELHKPTGNNWGGSTVNRAFLNFLIELFGRSVMKTLRNKHIEDYVMLFRDFELKKREVSKKKDKICYFRLPSSLEELVESETGSGIKETIAQSHFAEKLTIKGEKLKIPAPIMRMFFHESISNVIFKLGSVMEHGSMEGCKTIMMVGGYSECELLQEEIKQRFPDMDVVTPAGASLAVLKGAVMFGWNPQVISSRVCKYTYGVEVHTLFDPDIHPESRKYIDDDGDIMVANAFRILVQAGQDVSPSLPYQGENIQKRPGPETGGSLRLVASTEKDPKFTDEDGCFVVGTFHFDCMDMEGNISWVKPMLVFGGTEIEMRVVYETTEEEHKASFSLPD